MQRPAVDGVGDGGGQRLGLIGRHDRQKRVASAQDVAQRGQHADARLRGPRARPVGAAFERRHDIETAGLQVRRNTRAHIAEPKHADNGGFRKS